MELIVNVSENWGIGLQGRLLFTISADLRRFRRLTEGKTVILGRKTLQTFPGGRPLKNRRNLILSGSPDYAVDGAEVAHGLADLKAALSPDEEAAVIGGASVYELLLPYCAAARVTMTLQTVPADRFFPDLDRLPGWIRTAASEVQEENGLRFRYLDYENTAPLPL
ncbi:MAG: dihydrofolate reductase [Oscillospiraceae bacterium]|nr:dihydrofolate reductase [Oscillospiraceae bacterium]